MDRRFAARTGLLLERVENYPQLNSRRYAFRNCVGQQRGPDYASSNVDLELLNPMDPTPSI